MNSDLFERFLDNLELYLDLKKSHEATEKIYYNIEYGTDEYWRVASIKEESEDVVANQRDILQMLFEKMVGEDGAV